MVRKTTVELTNMVMVCDGRGRVLVQERRLSWKGISFPGGHVEPGESFFESAVREVKEETGLTVSELESCGVIDWLNTSNGERYLVFLYKTDKFSGELLPETDEGRVFWIDIEELKRQSSENGFQNYLPMFLTDSHKGREVFAPSDWSRDDPEKYIYY